MKKIGNRSPVQSCPPPRLSNLARFDCPKPCETHLAEVLHDNVPDGHLVLDALRHNLFFQKDPLALLQLLVVPEPLDLGLGNTGNDDLVSVDCN